MSYTVRARPRPPLSTRPPTCVTRQPAFVTGLLPGFRQRLALHAFISAHLCGFLLYWLYSRTPIDVFHVVTRLIASVFVSCVLLPVFATLPTDAHGYAFLLLTPTLLLVSLSYGVLLHRPHPCGLLQDALLSPSVPAHVILWRALTFVMSRPCFGCLRSP